MRESKLARTIATGFKSGYFPVASGTAGTVVAFIIYYFLKWFGFLELATVPVYLLFLFWITLIGTWSADVICKIEKKKDPSIIVIDEIVGFFFAVAFLPAKIYFVAPAFLIFRGLDILKPLPAKQAESLPGGTVPRLQHTRHAPGTHALKQCTAAGLGGKGARPGTAHMVPSVES